MLESIKKLLNKNKVQFDMFNNIDNDNCKSKYNSLMYFLLGYIEDLKSNVYTKKERQHYTNILKHNKETILMYLNMVVDILDNQNIDEALLNNEDLSYINVIRGNLDLTTLTGKKTVITQIRNAFAHKSGKITFFTDNDIKKVRIENSGWFAIEADLNQLNKLLESIIVKDSNNNIQSLILDTIDKVKKNNYKDISEDSMIIILLNLLMCYNKESIFDQYMASQSSFIDASSFEINSTPNWSCDERSLKKTFFNRYKLLFKSNEDKNAYINDWKSIVDIDSLTNIPTNNYLYDISKMPVDVDTNKHIPIPLFMNFLRNANCHGRIIIQGDDFIFYDQENAPGSPKYFYMKINKKDLLKFLSEDYFVESITTSIDKHKVKSESELYLIEQAESVNNFANYINIFRNKLQSLPELEVIKYMYDNNKFSSYLMEYPEMTDEFLNYRLSNGTLLIDHLCRITNVNKSKYSSMKSNRNKLLNIKSLNKGTELYNEYFKDYISKVKDPKSIDLESKTYEFFKTYYLYLRNIKTINPNITNGNQITPELIQEIKELQEEFIDNDVMLTLYDKNKSLLTKIGLYASKEREINKILFICSYNKYLKENESLKREDNRYTIKNVEKHSSLAHVFAESAHVNKERLSIFFNRYKKVFFVAMGLKMFNAIFVMVKNKLGYGVDPLTEAMLYALSIPIMSSTIFYNLQEAQSKAVEIDKQNRRIDKYSEKKDVRSDAIGIDGHNSISR